MDDSTAGHIELEYIVVDLVREKRLELVNGTHVLGLNSLLSISLVYPIHPTPSPIVSLLATPGCLCVCCAYSLVTGVSKWLPKWDFALLHWSHLPEGIRIPFPRYDPSGSLL